MKTALIFLSVLALASAKPQSKIIDGEATTIEEFPSMAALGITGELGFQHGCSGSLIGPEWVLTAGHCAVDSVSGTVILGNTFWRNPDPPIIDKYDISEIFPHPNYDEATISYDVGLIKLDRAAALETGRIEPTRVEPVMGYGEGEPVTAVGWGVEETGGSVSDDLNRLDKTLMSYENCKALFGDDYVGVDYCVSGQGGTTCNGDSGGPLFVNVDGDRRIIGITSFGWSGCPEGPLSAAAFTNVTFWFEWIDYNCDCCQTAPGCPEPGPIPTFPPFKK